MAVKLSLLVLASSWSSYVSQAQYTTTNKIKPGQTLHFSDKMLVSEDGKFQLGFFNTSYSPSKFLGIRFSAEGNSLSPWVWVANREAPIYNLSNTDLAMDENGLLEIITTGENNNKSSIMQLNPNRTSPESIIVLENSGNLVVKELNPDGTLRTILWESFDHPTDTLLPGMKLGGYKNGPVLVSWLTDSIPSTGPFTLEYNPSEPNFIIRRRGNLYSRFGPNVLDDGEADSSFVMNGTESNYFSYSSRNSSGMFLRLKPNSVIVHWDEDSVKIWGSECDEGLDYPSGCAGAGTVGPGKCRAAKEEFSYSEVRLLSNSSASARYVEDDPSIVMSDCLDRCWRNCSCIGFDTLNLDGTGCTFWNEEARFEQNALYGDHFFLLSSTYKKRFPEVSDPETEGNEMVDLGQVVLGGLLILLIFMLLRVTVLL